MLDEKSILKLQEKISAEYRADVAAIKRVLHLLKKNKIQPDSIDETAHSTRRSPIAVPVPNSVQTLEPLPATRHPQFDLESSGPETNGHNQENIESRIIEVIGRFEGNFTFTDLQAAVNREFGFAIERKTISWVIYRNKGKHIRVIQPGIGRRKALYAKM